MTTRTLAPIRVAILAPSTGMRMELHTLLAIDKRVIIVVEAADLDELAETSRTFEILILAGPGASNHELLTYLHKNPSISVLFLVEDLYLFQQLNPFTGGQPYGVLSIESSGDEISAAIQAIAAGLWVTNQVAILPFPNQTESGYQRGLPDELQPVDPLTDREKEVLQQMALGLANKQIAAALKVSENTIKFHVSSIYSKLNASNRAEAIRIGLRLGYLSL